MAATRTRRTQEQRRAETRAKLLDATIELLQEVGYAGTTTRAVAARAGVSGGAQTHHFPRRSDLVGAAVERLTAQRADAIRTAAATLPPHGPERIRALLDLLWADFSGPLFSIAIKLWVAADDDRELYERLTAIEKLMAGMLAELTKDLARELPGVDDLDPRIQAVLAALRGLALGERFEPRRRRGRAESWEALRPVLERVLTG